MEVSLDETTQHRRGHAMVQIHLLTADTSIELMERTNAVLAELQGQFCTIEDVKLSWMGSDSDATGQSSATLGVLIIYNTPVEQGMQPET
jgi:hypothetical protein